MKDELKFEINESKENKYYVMIIDKYERRFTNGLSYDSRRKATIAADNFMAGYRFRMETENN